MIKTRADYGNWTPKYILYILGAFGLVFLGLSFLSLFGLIGAISFFVAFIYVAYARYKFSPRGGNLREKIWDLVFDHLDWDGEGQAIDIGCGNAPLTIKLAQKFPHARVTGIDYWGASWEYSKVVCERNAEVEGVADRVSFQKASASTLPFDDEFFDAAISNLVFHEVRDSGDKRDVIKETLRVIKKGGKFAFQDLFKHKRIYGTIDELLDKIKGWGIEQVNFANTQDSSFIPKALRNSLMIGTIGIIYGMK